MFLAIIIITRFFSYMVTCLTYILMFDSFFNQRKTIQYFYKPWTRNITIQLSTDYNIRTQELESGIMVNFRLIQLLCEVIKYPDIKMLVVLEIQLLRKEY